MRRLVQKVRYRLPSASRLLSYTQMILQICKYFSYATGVVEAIALGSYIPEFIFRKVQPISRFTKLSIPSRFNIGFKRP